MTGKRDCPTPGKTGYPSKRYAERELGIIRRTGRTVDLPARVYRCDPGCGQWHLTKLAQERR